MPGATLPFLHFERYALSPKICAKRVGVIKETLLLWSKGKKGQGSHWKAFVSYRIKEGTQRATSLCVSSLISKEKKRFLLGTLTFFGYAWAKQSILYHQNKNFILYDPYSFCREGITILKIYQYWIFYHMYNDWNLFWDAKMLRTRKIMTQFKL